MLHVVSYYLYSSIGESLLSNPLPYPFPVPHPLLLPAKNKRVTEGTAERTGTAASKPNHIGQSGLFQTEVINAIDIQKERVGQQTPQTTSKTKTHLQISIPHGIIPMFICVEKGK
jgi:hypothetical protein